MKLILFIFLFLSSSLSFGFEESEWHIENFSYEYKHSKWVEIRAGYLEANGNSFKGNILYLQGLGDSMMNHGPLFKKLTSMGYRVISFDYMGQGGSEGSMGKARVLSDSDQEQTISNLAEVVWDKFRNDESEERIVIGWSTGGLVAYEMANRRWAQKVILIAPGICAKKSVGEGLIEGNRISLRTLTSASKYYGKKGIVNPHVDSIKPSSPLKVPSFAMNLLSSGKKARKWKIPSRVQGILFSAGKDVYVKTRCNKRTISKNAPHFEQVDYKKARHEIDNEVFSIQRKLFYEISLFLAH